MRPTGPEDSDETRAQAAKQGGVPSSEARTYASRAKHIGLAANETERELDEKYCWEHWLGDELSKEREHICHAVSQLFKEHSNSPPLRGFTPHAVTHCQEVENLLHRVIPGAAYHGLREYERFLLLTSAWLHDIGMIRELLGERDSKTSDEEIRAEHHSRSERFIVNHPARCGVRECDAPILGLLARLHGTPVDEWPRCDAQVGGSRVRVRLLAAYLCLADALHIDASRAPSDLYAICLAYNAPISSKIHWIKSRFVSGVDIDAEKRQIVLHFKVPCSAQTTELEKQSVTPEKISRIHDVVVAEVTRNLNYVKNELIKGGISYYLTVERRTVPMHLDAQVLRDLKHIVNNPDFMANPSSSRLAHLMLRTVADILDLEENGESASSSTSPDRSAPTDKAHEHEGCEESLSDRIEKYRRVEELLHDIDDGVLTARPCHVALQTLVGALRDKTSDAIDRAQLLKHDSQCDTPPTCWNRLRAGSASSPHPEGLNELEQYVREQLKQRGDARRNVRTIGKRYFRRFIDEVKRSEDASANDQAGAPPEAERRQELGGIEGLFDLPHEPTTVMLFGYSELVVKALCGFRDEVLAKLMRAYLDLQDGWASSEHQRIPFGLPLERPYHLARLECIASARFRIFVCTGEPKTQTSMGGHLGFHDGFQYVQALRDHGFNNIIQVTDIAAVGNLLHRTNSSGETLVAPGAPMRPPMVDLVMLGVNGIEGNRLRHGAGHLGVAAAVAALHAFYRDGDSLLRFTRLPRLVFVASHQKFKERAAPPSVARTKDAPPSYGRWSWLDSRCIEADGHWIQQGFVGEAVRDKAFLVPDRTMQSFFHAEGVRLYTPREEAVWISLVDDLIWDEAYFWGDGRAADTLRPRGQDRQGRAFFGDSKEGEVAALAATIERIARRQTGPSNGAAEGPGGTA